MTEIIVEDIGNDRWLIRAGAYVYGQVAKVRKRQTMFYGDGTRRRTRSHYAVIVGDEVWGAGFCSLKDAALAVTARRAKVAA